jgi:hypothetical protein
MNHSESSNTYTVSVSFQVSSASSSITIKYPEAEEQVSTWFETEGNAQHQQVGIWFEHPLDSNPYEITNIAIVNETLLNHPNSPGRMFSRISLPIDNPSLQTLNAVGGYVVLPPSNVQKAVFVRISELIDLAIEDGISMSPASFLDLWSFISKIPQIRPPSVFALDNGNYRAEWKNPEGELIGLEFCGDQLVKFVIFGYARALGRMMRVAGLQAISGIHAHLQAAFADHLLTN